jgi:segregation and condensation protein B
VQQAEQSAGDEAQQESQTETRKLTQEQKKAALEAVLFTVGDSVEITRLADVIGESVKKTRKLLSALSAEYENSNRGIMLTELENSYQLCSKPEFYDYLIKIAKAPRKYVLTDALLETLSIIAYKQPVTKVEIEKIRGVSSDHAVNRLVEFDLVCEVGRLDAPGRPILFGTTEQFLRSFGVKSLTELPEMNADRVAQFREEAEKEVQIKLDI